MAVSLERANSPMTRRMALSAFMVARDVPICTTAMAMSTVERAVTTRTSTSEKPRSPGSECFVRMPYAEQGARQLARSRAK